MATHEVGWPPLALLALLLCAPAEARVRLARPHVSVPVRRAQTCAMPSGCSSDVQCTHRRAEAFLRAEAGEFTVSTARSAQTLDEAAAFFVDAFWEASTSMAEPVKLTPRGRRALIEKQRVDMRERYGELVGVRRLKSELLVARSADGTIAGCIGLELAVLSVFDRTVLPRRSEPLVSHLASEMTCLNSLCYLS